MSEQLVITRQENIILTIRITDGQISQIQADTQKQEVQVGDIYVGKVRNIVKNINAAFVEYTKGKMGYLSLDSDLIPLHTDGSSQRQNRLLIGDEILVQISKEAVKTKPPTLTGQFELAGQYVVLSYTGQNNETAPSPRVSKKIKEKEQREEIKQILYKYSDPRYGLIARTNSANVSLEMMEREIAYLIHIFEEIMTQGIHRSKFQKIYQALPGYLSVFRDTNLLHIDEIITDQKDVYDLVLKYLSNRNLPVELLSFWNEDNGKLDAIYNISSTIQHLLMPKVWLKHGGYLVIQPTEAFISIDVNTGKAISKKKDIQETFRKTNEEAALEIAKQLRLRNLSGIIIIDFIDMKSTEDQNYILEVLRKECFKDSVQTTVVDMTKLGLVEVTRKKIRKPLWQQLSDCKQIETDEANLLENDTTRE